MAGRIIIPCSNLTDLFFSDSVIDRKLAKHVCADCPVKAQCLAAALGRSEKFGVWGGKDFQLRKRRKPKKDGGSAPAGKVSGTSSQGGSA